MVKTEEWELGDRKQSEDGLPDSQTSMFGGFPGVSVIVGWNKVCGGVSVRSQEIPVLKVWHLDKSLQSLRDLKTVPVS